MASLLKPDDEKTYCYDEQRKDIATGLNRQRMDVPTSGAPTVNLCDVIVRCGTCADETDDRQLPIRAHSCVLATSCGYFQTLFSWRTDRGATARQNEEQRTIYERFAPVEIVLPFVSRDIVSKVIDFLYTGSISLSMNTVFDVLQLADYLGVPHLIGLCGTHLMAQLNRQNVLDILRLIYTYSTLATAVPQLVSDVQELVSRSLPEIMLQLGDRFRVNDCGYDGRNSSLTDLPISPKMVRRLLENDEIGSVCVQDVFEAVCRFCKDWNQQMTSEECLDTTCSLDVWNLLDSVEFDFLPTRFLRDRIMIEADVINWLRYHKPNVLHRAAAIYVNDRDVADVIICRSRSARPFGSDPVRLVVYDIDNDEWNYLRLPDVEFENSSADTAATDQVLPTAVPVAHVNSASRAVRSLDDLEAMTVHAGNWLYVLCSTSDDTYSYYLCDGQQSAVVKSFWRLDLSQDETTIGSRGGSGSSHEGNSGPCWHRLPSPTILQHQCRLTSDAADAIYAIDHSGRVEVFSIAACCWTILCRIGFTAVPMPNLYLLPIPVSSVSTGPMGSGFGLPQLYVVRAFSAGYCMYYASKSVAIYRLEFPQRSATPRDQAETRRLPASNVSVSGSSSSVDLSTDGVWNVLERSEIEFTDLYDITTSQVRSADAENGVTFGDVFHFHGYVISPGRIQLTDELGRVRAQFDTTIKDWLPPPCTAQCPSTSTDSQYADRHPSSVQQQKKPIPKFIGDVLGSTQLAGRVYCATRGRPELNGRGPLARGRFVVYDHIKDRYQALTTGPVPLSGLVCRATVTRSALVTLTTPCQRGCQDDAEATS